MTESADAPVVEETGEVDTYDDDEAFDAADEGYDISSPEEEAILYAQQLQDLADAGFGEGE